MNTPKWFVTQYNYAKSQGWIPYFQEAASKYNFSTEDMIGLASRESNLKNIKGDFHDGVYHGFSLMQLDINSYRSWINSGAWKNVSSAVMKGAEALATKRDLIVKASKQSTATIKFRSGKTVRFTPKPFDDDELRQITLAGYNCGLAGYYHFSLDHDIDAGTTGKDYSDDVMKRSEWAKELLAKDFAPPEAVTPQAPVVVTVPPATDDDGEDTGDQADIPDATEGTTPPAPQAVQSQFPFGTLEDKYNRHADLIQSPTTKQVAVGFCGRAGSGLAMVWGTTGGKVALFLSGAVIVGTVTLLVIKYRQPIASFFVQLKDYVKGKF